MNGRDAVIRWVVIAGMLAMGAGYAWAGDGAGAGEGAGATTRAIGVDARRQRVEIPVWGRATVAIFLQPGQRTSELEIAQVRQELRKAKEVAVVGIVSGRDSAGRAAGLREQGWEWPVVIDEGFAVSGAFEVHAWPTTMVFDAQGKLVGRIAGNPASLKISLMAYLGYLSGAMTREQLEEELTELRIVEDSREEKALRHLLLVQQLVGSGRREDAAKELQAAKELAPEGAGSAGVRLLLVRCMLLLGEGAEADRVLATLDRGKGEWPVLAGWSDVLQERWAGAREHLVEAQKQTLEPALQAEGQYWLGVVYEHGGEHAEAAKAFRRAYELSVGVGTPR